MSKSLYDLVRKPVITEKSTILKEQNKYIFQVLPAANKASVKKAIESIFGVKVKSVNILNQVGKKKVFKGRFGIRSDVKKAFVTLENGYDINLVEEVK